MNAPGSVVLAGGGAGAADVLTLRARRALFSADVADVANVALLGLDLRTLDVPTSAHTPASDLEPLDAPASDDAYAYAPQVDTAAAPLAEVAYA